MATFRIWLVESLKIYEQIANVLGAKSEFLLGLEV